jgi:hypothetical protein
MPNTKAIFDWFDPTLDIRQRAKAFEKIDRDTVKATGPEEFALLAV